MRVLIVEDNQDYACLMQKAFQKLNFETVIKSSGEAGIQWAGENDFDLALIDFYLPGLDGLQVAEILKSRTPDLKIAITSAVSLRLLKDVSSGEKFDLLVSKPMNAQTYSSTAKLVVH